MITGKPLLGNKVNRAGRIMIMNFEDLQLVLDLRVTVAMKHYQLSEADIGGKLFVEAMDGAFSS